MENKRTTSLRKKQNNISLAIYSVLIAILAWFVISMTFYPSVPKTIKNVELNIDISGTSAAENGLSVISCDVKKVSVQIKGSRTQVGNINADSLVAYIDAESVRTTGKKTLNIKVKSENGDKFELESVSPETAVVEFDKYDTLDFPVSPQIPEINFVDGKTIYPDEFSCEPDTISITGPAAQLAKIDKVYAVSQKSMTLDSSYTLSSDEIQLLAEDGTVVDQSMMKFNMSNFNINIPVITQKDVDVAVSIVNAPSDFDKEWFMSLLSFSTDKLTIASKNSQTSIPDTLEIGKIVLSDVDIDPAFTSTFSIDSIFESSNMINMSNLDQITVSLDNSNLVKKQFVLDNEKIHISNPPDSSEYDYTVVPKSLEIYAVGPEDVISQLTPADFVADANLLNANNLKDQFLYDVTLSCLSSKRVWAVTKTKVLIQRTKHIDEDAENQTSLSGDN